MTPDALRKGLRAGGWTAAVVAVVALTVALLGGLGFRWDPLNLEQRRRVRAEARASEAAASARGPPIPRRRAAASSRWRGPCAPPSRRRCRSSACMGSAASSASITTRVTLLSVTLYL
jgi:hypothetical protein